MKEPIAWRWLRWVYAAFYIIIGLQAALSLLGFLPKPDFNLSPENTAFQEALAKTGFIVPIMSLAYMVAGTALLFCRTAPLGIVLLTPFIVVIFFTNILLEAKWIWGTAHTLILIALAWHFRQAFRSLWNYQPTTDAA